MYNYKHIKQINKKVEDSINKLIVDNESRYRGQLFTLVNKILSKKGIKIVLLSGPSCAGKTTSANLIKEILEIKGKEVDVISMDDFFMDLDKRKPLPNGKPDYDSPDILDYELMKDCFARYFAGEDVKFPEYDFKNSKSVRDHKPYKYKHNSIIIFEGIHVLNPRVIENLGTSNYFRLYISPLDSFKCDKKVLTTKNLRLLRRVVRDIERRNTPAAKTIEMWPEVTIIEEKYIEPYRNKVDYFVNTTHEYELGIYKSELDKYISENRVKEEEIPFWDMLKEVEKVDKSKLPSTSLMWEFVNK